MISTTEISSQVIQVHLPCHEEQLRWQRTFMTDFAQTFQSLHEFLCSFEKNFWHWWLFRNTKMVQIIFSISRFIIPKTYCEERILSWLKRLVSARSFWAFIQYSYISKRYLLRTSTGYLILGQKCSIHFFQQIQLAVTLRNICHHWFWRESELSHR